MLTAEPYPTKPVRIIVPFPPAGSNDIVARTVATPLGERLGKQLIVDNRPGAGAVVGTELAADAPKDGYTLLIVSLTHAINPWLYKLPYDPIQDFAPIAMIASGPIVLTANAGLAAKSVNELIALAKAKPGRLQYASAGVGTLTHLSAELFKLAAGIDMLHVPFRGGGPADIDLIGGHTKVMFNNVPTAMPASAPASFGPWVSAGPSASLYWPMCRRSPRPASLVTKQAIGGASWRRPARPQASSSGCTRRSPPSRILRMFKSSSRPKVRRSCA